MIRIKDISRELDEVIATIEFDWQGETHELTMRVKADVLLGMSKEDIVDTIKKRVARERMNLAEDDIKELLGDLIGVDLEAV
mgnify:CR=1 FL=1